MKCVKYFLLIGFLFLSSYIYSQGRIRRTNNFQSYKERTNVVYYNFGLSYLKYESQISTQLELLYTKRMSDFLSVGLGYSGIFTEHYLSIVNVEMAFKPLTSLSVFLKPGLMMDDRAGKITSYYMLGWGVRYHFKISEDLYLGPMVEMDVIQNETNYQVGVSFGIAF